MTGNGRRKGRRQSSELVVAATEYVIENGVSALSLRPLAATLGISHRTLLYHFGSKEQLLQEILREARTQERLRAVSRPEPEGTPSASSLLRDTWAYLSGPSEHRFWRFYFEVHGLALQEPERFDDVLTHGVTDWLTTTEDLLVGAGVPAEQAAGLATFVVAAFRGLMLDLLSTGDTDRVNAGFEVLAGLVEWVEQSGARDKPGAEA